MRFMMMIKSDPRSESGLLPEAKLLAEMAAFNDEMAKAGVMLSAEGLKASVHGARVRMSGTKLSVLDGPFSEARDLVGGFWLIQTASLEDAIAWAKRVPFSDREIELRQLYELSDIPADPSETADGWREQERAFREGGASSDGGNAGAPPAPARKPGTTRYLVMLKSDRVTESGALPTPRALAEMGALMDDLATSGNLLGGEGLKPSAKGAKVRFAGGKRTVIDGPFTEAKEMIAGYSLIQVPSKEDAVALAKGWLKVHLETSAEPLESGEIEIRALLEREDFPADATGTAADGESGHKRLGN